MSTVSWTTLLILIAFTLPSCSKISEGKSTTETDNPNTNIPVSAASFNISGRISVIPFIQIDSDINDPLASTYADNSVFSSAQVIDNFSTINGFATIEATGRSDTNDRFAVDTDPIDLYQLNLQKNQIIRLQVVDFSLGGLFTGDLDIYLLDADLNTIAFSNALDDEFEALSVPADGFYYIYVDAYSGSSKYILTLDNVASINSSTATPLEDFIPNQAIVKYKSGRQQKSSSINSVSIQTSHTDNRATLANFNYSAKSNTALSAFEQELSSINPSSFNKLKTLKTIKLLKQQSDVEYAEPNYIRRALATPNDSLYNLQWHYPSINLPQAWDITIGERAQDVIVAVIDTGVFLAHTDLNNKIIDGFDFISDPSNALDTDGIDSNPDDPGDSLLQAQSSWHGTHVAGTIAAETNNNSGIAGVSWAAKIMPLRVLGSFGGSSYDIIQAVLFAAGLANDSNTTPPQIADVINLSLGGGGFSSFEQDAYTRAYNAGVIIVAAAGNENTSIASYPASYDGVISVSATALDNSLAPYSNFGSRIDIAAPGGNQQVDLDNNNNVDGILSTLVDDSTGTRKATYALYQGTSMAAPHIAGVVALMRAVNPNLTPNELDLLIRSGAISTDLGVIGRDDSFGYGLIDAFKAVQEALALFNTGLTPTLPAVISAEPQRISLGSSTIQASITLSNIGDETAQITNVSNDADWLSIAENIVDSNKLGSYSISVDKSGLSNNTTYVANITFTVSTGATINVPVTLINGTISQVGEVGTLYLLLIDSTDTVIEQLIPTSLGQGIYSYNFSDIEAGDYTLIVGSDVDNDLIICQLGESCGAYPTLSRISTITLNSDKTNLDFTVDILATQSTTASSSKQDQPTGYKRLTAPTQ